ncbi:MAG: type II secretion system F family protein [Candidatus Omnitrophica bacterium]|nr:type II secretion system F family protein [Candidatus Omnitrophota bacterium]
MNKSFLQAEIKVPEFLKRKRANFKELVQFTRQAATLVRAGLPLVRSLDTLHEQLDKGYLKECVGTIAEEVKSGTAFSEALSHYRTVFPPLYVNMVRAGEQGGMLEEILKRLADFLEKQERLRTRIKSALMYPIFVLGVAILILVVLMIFVVPTFTKMFEDLGGALPLPTMILIGISDLFRYRWYWVVAAIAAVIGLVKLTARLLGKSRWDYCVDNIRLHLPVFGELIRKAAIAIFARTLGTLLTSGVSILNALDTVKEIAGNEIVKRGIGEVRESIKEGESVSGPLSRCKAFDPMVVKMVAIGEETGQLNKMLVEIAASYEEEVDVMVSGLTALLEPLLIVFLGLVVGFIVIAMFLPLFSMARLIA